MLDEKEIIDAVNTSADLRLINLGATYPQGSVLPSLIAVERFPINAPYGTFIDRGSNITIIATSCPLEPCLSWVSWYIALFGGFNFVAKQHEINHSHTSVSSFYNIPLDPEKRDLNLKKFIEDINSLSRTDMRNCNICLLTSSFGDEPDYPTQMHFTFGASRGDETYGDVEHLTIKDIPTFDAMFNDMSEMLGEFGMTIDHHRFHKSNINNLTNHIMPESEKFTIRMSADFTIRNQHRVLIIHKMAEIIRKHYAPNTPMPDSAQFKIAGDGYEL